MLIDRRIEKKEQLSHLRGNPLDRIENDRQPNGSVVLGAEIQKQRPQVDSQKSLRLPSVPSGMLEEAIQLDPHQSDKTIFCYSSLLVRGCVGATNRDRQIVKSAEIEVHFDAFVVIPAGDQTVQDDSRGRSRQMFRTDPRHLFLGELLHLNCECKRIQSNRTSPVD